MARRVDRIAEPWGTRTPYARGETWPSRVDMFLDEGLAEDDVDAWVQSATILHSNGDGLDIAVKDGRIVGVRGRVVDRVNHGRLGPKDLFGWQANHSPDRLTHPLVRRDGRLVQATWDEAMGRVVARTKELLAEQGASAIGFYTTGQLFLEEYYTLGVIAHGGLGTNHVDGNTRLCTATAAAALKESFGCDGQPGSYTDIDHADVIALWGHNMAETQTVLWTRVLDRLAGPTPPQVICVDPRLTQVARHATVHLAPRPGTNVALMNGLLHEVLAHDWVDHAYVEAHAVGYEELEQRVAEYPPERVAQICDVPVEQIREAARILGTAERLLSSVLQGFYQSAQATAAAVQVNNLHIVRGMLGKPGCGVLQMNGQPTAQNTREAGADGDLCTRPACASSSSRSCPRQIHDREDAMLTTEVAPGVHRLQHAHVNVYLVADDDGRLLLVDTGLPRTWPLIGHALRELGHRPSDVVAVVLTHAHFDHTGSAAAAVARGLPVWVHREDVGLSAHPYRYAHENPRAAYPLRHPAALPILAAMAAAGALRVKGVSELHELPPDGSVLPLPGGPVLIETPGHTYGHCALHLPGRDAVISGDALVTLDPYTAGRGPQIIAGAATADSALALASLDRLAATGASVVLPGHGEPWTGGAAEAVARARAVGAH